MHIKVLLLGTTISNNMKKRFIDMGIRPAPADIAQQYIIDGLTNINNITNVQVIGSPRIPFYPKVKIKKVDNDYWQNEKVTYKTIGFSNFPFWGFFEREKRIEDSVIEWVKKTTGLKLLLIYSVHSPFLRAALKAKRIDNNLKIGLIVPDLPQYMGNYSCVKKALKYVDGIQIKKMLKEVDNFFLYTKDMAECLNLSPDKWIVFEGLIDQKKIEPRPTLNKNSTSKICIYAGSLDERYAIDTLIKAFERTNENAELRIYGDPKVATRLDSLLNKCHKTKFMGMVSSDEIFKLMRRADLLINPRPSNLPLAKYSFPSKTFEYMATGTPVLMTRLPGIPDEYFKYMYVVEDETIDGFRNKLEEILSTNDSELYNMGRNAQSFLLEKKTAQKQVERIINFVFR